MYLIWMFIGVIACVWLEQSWFAAAVGALLGLLWGRLSSVSRSLGEVKAALKQLSESGTAARPLPSTRPEAVSQPWRPADPATLPLEHSLDDDEQAAAAPAPPPIPAVTIGPVSVASPPLKPSPLDADMPEPPRLPPRGPGFGELLWQRAWGWLSEGNVPVKIGMLVLFAGVAALLKYAADSGMLKIPIELRVCAVALAAMAALFFGWRQREQRRGFALSLQGGAIGVLVITIFAAFRLYDLLPPMAAFALLIILIAGVGLLAVLQESLALAVLGLLAGFAAPILTSTGHGNHVALFSYYAVLNLAVLAIAWVRAWRVLNLLGFIATFGIGTAWGVLSYRPELFASTEPFLILNFLFYLIIPWLYLRRTSSDREALIDGSLLFGNPLISLLLQGALLRWQGTDLAISALVAAVIYIAVAWSVRDHRRFGVLRDAWAVLAIGFATLAVPLALDASLTASVFALEGAGLIWLGLRQGRGFPRWCGLGLQVFAAIALIYAYSRSTAEIGLPVLNRDFIGAMLIVAGGWASSWLYQRQAEATWRMRTMSVLLYVWGMLWWLGAAAAEIDRVLSGRAELAAVWMLLVVSAWAVAEVARRKPRVELAQAVAFSAPLLTWLSLLPVLTCFISGWQPLHGWLLLAVATTAALGWRMLACLRDYPTPAILAQLGWWWRWAMLAGVAILVAFGSSFWLADAWRGLLVSAPALLLWFIALQRPGWLAAPLPAQRGDMRRLLMYSLLAVMTLVFALGLLTDGNAAPLRYLPLLNPLELLLLAILACFAYWSADAATPAGVRRLRPAIFGIVAMVFITSATLRAVHHLGGVPWSDEMVSSSLAQMSLTVVWSVLGVLAWIGGSLRRQRMLWLAGAVTMGVVLLKLLLVDRGHLGNLFGISSFIAYGLLCTVIGYFAPAPPRSSPAPSKESTDAL
ncbi:DUF2339 domain-containing protein [Dyella silvatica]|uniref:DUF2339 domain-containing protein n=1 Tax=Dyella silvatica TaxID=2992128 RepID=UPI0022562044|nr:DUF2339 domain-containing protein [Dyella silvatica]